MKVAHLETSHSHQSLPPLEQAVLYEKSGEYEKAIDIYESLVRERPSNEMLYNRLMIIYRKQKEYRKELKTIIAGIKAFEELYTPNTGRHGKNVAKISLALARSTGLIDKKGKNLFDPEPIAKWKKRKALVEGKLKGKK
jgi:tetratricopeptide (TPR) repeat protein